MMKNWKSLFVKDEEAEQPELPKATDAPSFPIQTNNTTVTSMPITNTNSAETEEVMAVYEKGLDSINMPGYDFYEFYKAVQIAPHNDQAYGMAYQMAKTLDNTLSVSKLITDADFYVSKINEVYSQYVQQGQSKLNQIAERKAQEKGDLTKIIENNNLRISQIKAELTQLENDTQVKRNNLAKVDESFLPQENGIRTKLNANEVAKNNSIGKLNLVKDNIQRFLKNN